MLFRITVWVFPMLKHPPTAQTGEGVKVSNAALMVSSPDVHNNGQCLTSSPPLKGKGGDFVYLPLLDIKRDKVLCQLHENTYNSRWCTQCIIEAHNLIRASAHPNFKGCRIPIPTQLKVEFWEKELSNRPEADIIDFIKFGWPLGFEGEPLATKTVKNHKGATDFPKLVDD